MFKFSGENSGGKDAGVRCKDQKKETMLHKVAEKTKGWIRTFFIAEKSSAPHILNALSGCSDINVLGKAESPLDAINHILMMNPGARISDIRIDDKKRADIEGLLGDIEICGVRRDAVPCENPAVVFLVNREIIKNGICVYVGAEFLSDRACLEDTIDTIKNFSYSGAGRPGNMGRES